MLYGSTILTTPLYKHLIYCKILEMIRSEMQKDKKKKSGLCNHYSWIKHCLDQLCYWSLSPALGHPHQRSDGRVQVGDGPVCFNIRLNGSECSGVPWAECRLKKSQRYWSREPRVTLFTDSQTRFEQSAELTNEPCRFWSRKFSMW